MAAWNEINVTRYPVITYIKKVDVNPAFKVKHPKNLSKGWIWLNKRR
jgi:hypothetical protein